MQDLLEPLDRARLNAVKEIVAFFDERQAADLSWDPLTFLNDLKGVLAGDWIED